MKKIILAITISLFIVGCSNNDENLGGDTPNEIVISDGEISIKEVYVTLDKEKVNTLLIHERGEARLVLEKYSGEDRKEYANVNYENGINKYIGIEPEIDKLVMEVYGEDNYLYKCSIHTRNFETYYYKEEDRKFITYKRTFHIKWK